MKYIKSFVSFFLICLTVCMLMASGVLGDALPSVMAEANSENGRDYIKWVDFDVSYDALKFAASVDITTYEQDMHISWIDILAYLGVQYGGDFSRFSRADADKLTEQLKSGKTMDEITSDMKFFPYYYDAYRAVLGNFIGVGDDGTYGVIARSPIATGYWYNESDDFGNGRNYGFARKHLGHDMFTSVGTPVIAVEGGRVEVMGWNQYGGWRIGIRSHDGQRYYYYAHLRKGSPYASGLHSGDMVTAGQTIGYTGQTGYSLTPDKNNINVPHLHFGMQLIFDESQKECNSEIWIDTYQIIKFLSGYRAEADAKAMAAVSSATTDIKDISLPVLMYHGITDKETYVNKYFISDDALESDLKYLSENGFTAITCYELLSYVSGRTDFLPEKPVMLTFDDGYCNNYNLATPLLEKYNMRGILSVIGNACEVASEADYRAEDFCNVTWYQLNEMSRSGYWEIQNHTYNLHDNKNGRQGALKKKGENDADYEKVLCEDLSRLQDKVESLTGTSPIAFAWPFGAITTDSNDLLKRLGFHISFTCYEGESIIKKGDPDCLFDLKRTLRTPSRSAESILKAQART